MADEEQGKKRRRGRHRSDANDAGKDDLTKGDVSGETSAADSDTPDVVADQPETADDKAEEKEPEDGRSWAHRIGCNRPRRQSPLRPPL